MKKLILLFTLLSPFTANAKQCVVEVSPLLLKYNDTWRPLSFEIEFNKKNEDHYNTFNARYPNVVKDFKRFKPNLG